MSAYRKGFTVFPKIRTASITAVSSTLLLLASAGVAAASTAPAAGPAGPTPATPCATTSVIKVDSFVFDPASVSPGESSAATLSTTNCTDVTQATSETWYGRFLGPSSSGFPAGCPVIDPYSRSVTYAPLASVTTATSYLVPSGCTATELEAIVTIYNSSGTEIASATAYLLI
jgi:hypothetical protein